ncbi:hypothetical protein [Streptomyces sp. NPDC058279]|uniref:hypothetical protein n=1 Tax=Streptomyces sp. NPDC058279 TaxID=3346418 RepID=UPI0036E6F419
MHRFAAALLVSTTALIALPVASARAAAPAGLRVVGGAAVAGDIGWDSAKPAPTPLPGA